LDNNDLLRRLRYALSLDDSRTVNLIKLGGGEANADLACRWRLKDDDPQFRACDTDTVNQFLAGLIIDKRGPAPQAENRSVKKNLHKKQSGSESRASGDSTSQNDDPGSRATLDNNTVLKQLRIALSLRSDNVHDLLRAGGSRLSATEVSAFFRKPDARNYRRCGDQVLRQFINGLAAQREKSSPSGKGNV